MNIEQSDNFIASLGHEAYRVGGSVRDQLIGREPKDADYMIRGTSLIELYGDLIRALRGTAKISDLTLRDGQHVGYRIGKPYNIEITLPRREVSTGPGHSDFMIVVDGGFTLKEDAQRRDFTFNALYAPVGELHDLGGLRADADGSLVVKDPTGRGLHDLQRRIINVTHADSFRDDPLRILRALRFVARSYDLGPETRALMALHADAITGLTHNGHMSGTVYQEMSNILMGTEARTALRVARDTGVLGSLFPELKAMCGFDQSSKYHDLTTDEHTFAALDVAVTSEASLRVRWALLFHDSGKPDVAWTDEKGYKHFYARLPKEDVVDSFDGHLNLDHEEQSEWLWRQAAERMGVDKATREDVATLIRHHMVPFKSKGVAARTRRMRVQFGPGLLYDLLMHRVCDLRGKDGSANQKHIDQIRDMVRYMNDARERKVPYRVRDLLVNGHDVIVALPDEKRDSKMIGLILDAVLDEVVVRADELALTREWQLSVVARLAKVM